MRCWWLGCLGWGIGGGCGRERVLRPALGAGVALVACSTGTVDCGAWCLIGVWVLVYQPSPPSLVCVLAPEPALVSCFIR